MRLEQSLKKMRPGPGPVITEANLLAARGILAYWRQEYAAARKWREEAVQIDPLMEEAWELLPWTAWYQPGSGTKDLEGVWNEVDRLAAEAHSHDRGYSPHLTALGETRYARAEWRMILGQDPMPDFAAAEEAFSEALRLDEAPAFPWRWRGRVRAMRAVYHIGRGEDPLRDLEAAERDFDEGLQREPAYWYGDLWRRRGAVRTTRALWRTNQGEDPQRDFEAAEQDFAEALKIGEPEKETWNERGALRIRRGIFRMSEGNDPRKDFGEAERDFTQALRLYAAYPKALTNRGYLRTLSGLWKMDHDADPTEDFANAEKDLTEGLRLTAGAAPEWFAGDALPPWRDRARVRIHRAVFRMNRGEDPQEDFASAQKDLQEAVAFNRADAEVWVLQGDLGSRLGLFHEKAGDKVQALRHYAAGVTAYREAFRLNALLERRAGDRLRDAEKKAQEFRRP
jgi:tetratricopeptide (TPR) repeat protein